LQSLFAHGSPDFRQAIFEFLLAVHISPRTVFK
jgi:hypothetical protein